MKSFLTVAVFLALVSGPKSFAEQQSSVGGWGQACNAGPVYCPGNGSVIPTIGCNVSNVDSNQFGRCTAHSGNQGWVSCEVFDASGTRLTYSWDKCGPQPAGEDQGKSCEEFTDWISCNRTHTPALGCQWDQPSQRCNPV